MSALLSAVLHRASAGRCPRRACCRDGDRRYMGNVRYGMISTVCGMISTARNSITAVTSRTSWRLTSAEKEEGACDGAPQQERVRKAGRRTADAMCRHPCASTRFLCALDQAFSEHRVPADRKSHPACPMSPPTGYHGPEWQTSRQQYLLRRLTNSPCRHAIRNRPITGQE